MWQSMRVLGVDPGQSGGLAVIDGAELVDAIRMPTYQFKGKAVIDGRAIINWLADIEPDRPAPFDCAVIEAVHAMPRQGVTSSFQFGRMLGGVEVTVTSYGKPVEYVSPATWKKAMGLDRDKASSIDMAKLKFGKRAEALIKFKADDGLAEAALLAAYWHGRL